MTAGATLTRVIVCVRPGGASVRLRSGQRAPAPSQIRARSVGDVQLLSEIFIYLSVYPGLPAYSLSLSVSHGLSFSLSHSAADSCQLGPARLSRSLSRRARASFYTLRFCFSHVYLSGSDRSETASSLSHTQPYTADPGSLSRCAVDIVRLPLHSTKGARERGAHGARQAGCTHDHLVEQRAQARAARVSRGALGAGR